ncbi:MAG: ABC transporter substrate-binding protein [Myxococcales bacterium]|nr:ABC transporter substrate-binding protein [Myxococcales bacterium]
MRTIVLPSMLALAVLLARPIHAASDPSALEALTQASAEIEALARTEAKTAAETAARADRVRAEVDALLDVHAITVAALGGPSHWAERCAERCAEVESLLGQLVRRTYLRRLESGAQGRVEILREHVRAKASKVDTRVHYTDARGEPKTAAVDYVMHQVQGRWRVRDILTEGASLVGNLRYELAQLHAQGGIDEVLATLRRKVAERAENG